MYLEEFEDCQSGPVPVKCMPVANPGGGGGGLAPPRNA